MPLQDDVIHRERTCLVGAQDIHRTEVLNGVDPLDDDFFAGHRQGAFGKAHRDDHRQHFGRQPDGYGEGEEERFVPASFGHPIDDEHQGHHDQHEAEHEPREPRDARRTRFAPAARQAFRPCCRCKSRLPWPRRRRVAEPLSTLVPRKAMLSSSKGDVAGEPLSTSNFSTGNDSPVSEPWMTNRSLAETIRTSAGIMSPAASFTTSPGHELRDRQFLSLSVSQDGSGDRDHRLQLRRRVSALPS